MMTGLVFISPRAALACSCQLSPKPLKTQVKQAFGASAAIFSGEVLDISRDPNSEGRLLVKIKVTENWKGKTAAEVLISTEEQSSMCGYTFEVGNTYLIYAYGSNAAGLSTTNCSRTARRADNQDIAFLKKLKPKKG